MTFRDCQDVWSIVGSVTLFLTLVWLRWGTRPR